VKWLKKLVMPHPVVAVAVILAGFGLLVYSFVFAPHNMPLSYVAYGLSAWALAVLCGSLPRLFRWGKRVKMENSFLLRYFSQPEYRVKLSLYSSLTLNLLYTLLQLGSGLCYNSAWYYALAGYYGILAIMRYFLLKETKRERVGENLFVEYLHYRLCGALLLLLNLALGAVVAYMVWQDRGIRHHPIVTIAMAAYTFTATTMAIINVYKYRKYHSPVLESAKIISFASALVSMLSLEAAMLTTFGENENPTFRRIMLALSGGAVCVVVLVMAIYMTVHGTMQIKKHRGEKTYGRTQQR